MISRDNEIIVVPWVSAGRTYTHNIQTRKRSTDNPEECLKFKGQSHRTLEMVPSFQRYLLVRFFCKVILLGSKP